MKQLIEQTILPRKDVANVLVSSFFLSCWFHFHDFNFPDGQLQFAAEDHDSEIRIVAAIHEAALCQRELCCFPGSCVSDSNIADFSKRSFEQTFCRVGAIIFHMESRTSRVTIGDFDNNCLIEQAVGEGSVHIEVKVAARMRTCRRDDRLAVWGRDFLPDAVAAARANIQTLRPARPPFYAFGIGKRLVSTI